MVKHLTKVACLAFFAGFIAFLPTRASAEIIYQESGGKVVVEAENYSWINNRSNSAAHVRGWLLDSVSGATTATHPRTTAANWTTRKATNTGPSGDFIYAGNPTGDTDNGYYADGADGPPANEAGVGYLIRIQTTGRYYVYCRMLEMAGGSSNRAHYQFNWFPVNDGRSGVKSWGSGAGTQLWNWNWGREGVQAIEVKQPGTYWLRVYHNETEFSLDQIVLSQSATVPALPANDFKDAESAKVTVTSIIGSGSRAIGASNYVAGGAAVAVTLTLNATAAGNFVATDTLPTGFTASNVVASVGSVTGTGTGQLVWTASPAAAGPVTLTYDATPAAGACGTARFQAVYDGIPVEAGANAIVQEEGAGDGWPNAPINWAASFDSGATINAAAPTDARWFACNNRYELLGSGEDIWGGNDEARWLGLFVTGDCAISAKVELERPPDLYDTWVKAGVFIRDGVANNSAYMGALLRRDGRMRAQWRATNGNGTSFGRDFPDPQNRMSSGWFKVERQGANVSVSYDTLDGNAAEDWLTTSAIQLSDPVFIGLGITVHRGDAEAVVSRGIFSQVVTTGTVVAISTANVTRDLPSTFTAGAQFPVSLTVRPFDISGGGQVVTTETLPAGVTPANIVVSAGATAVVGNSIVWTIPAMPAVNATMTYDAAVPAAFCRQNLAFGGQVFNGFETFNVTGETALNWFGYDMTARKPTGQTDSGLAAAPGLGPLLRAQDIGNTAFTGASLFYACDNTFVLYASGGDIWDPDDNFHYMYVPVQGNFSLSATVRILMAPDYWTKAGLMARDNLTPGSPNAFVLLRGDNNGANPPEGIRAQVRYDQNGGSGDTGAPTDAANNSSATLTISRTGTAITLGFNNEEGLSSATWKVLNVPNVSTACLLGLAVTSHNNGAIGAASFQNVAATATPYAPTIGAAARVLGAANATPGVPLNVTLNIPRLADATSVSVVENVPPGSIVTSISGGGVLAGNTITWTIAPFTASAALTYTVVPQITGNPYAPYLFAGASATDNLGWGVPIADSLILPGGVFALQQGITPDITYSGTHDSHVIVYQFNNNQGGNDAIEEGTWDGGTGDHKKAMVQFDIPALPAGFTPNRVLLNLYHFDERRADYRNARVVNLQRILKPWNEGTGGGYDGRVATDGEVTWNQARHNQQTWEIAGLMGLTDSGPFITSASISGNWPMWVSWDVTQSALDMITTPSQNFGWKISQDKVRGVADNDAANSWVQGAYDYRSRNHGNPAERPQLVFVDNSQLYVPLISAATRTVGAWRWGDNVNVSIQVTAAAAGTSIAVTEVLPPGWTVVSIANGGVETSPGNIRWNVAPFTLAGATVSYVATTAGWPQIPVASFTGGNAADIGGATVHVVDSYVKHNGVVVLQQGVWPDPSYAGTADAHVIVHSDGNNNTGGNDIMEEGHWNAPTEDHKKLLVRFDLAGVTVTAADVTSAQLLLFYDFHRSGGGPDHAIFTQKILKPWGEGAGTGTDGRDVALAGEVTWNVTGSDAGSTVAPTWEIPGLMGVTDVGPLFTNPGSAAFGVTTDIWVALTVTNDVQDFLATPAGNNGWKVGQDLRIGEADNAPKNQYVSDPNGAAFDFRTSENGTVNTRPILVIWTSTAVPVEVTRFMLY